MKSIQQYARTWNDLLCEEGWDTIFGAVMYYCELRGWSWNKLTDAQLVRAYMYNILAGKEYRVNRKEIITYLKEEKLIDS